MQVANYLVDRLGKKCMTAELLQPDELISGMISQVAAEPEMALLLNHFIYSTAGTCPVLPCMSQLLDAMGGRQRVGGVLGGWGVGGACIHGRVKEGGKADGPRGLSDGLQGRACLHHTQEGKDC